MDEHGVAAPPDQMRFPSVDCQVQPKASHGDRPCTCCRELHGVKRYVWAAVAHVSIMRHRLRSFLYFCVLMEQRSSAFVSQDASTVTAGLMCTDAESLASTLAGRRKPNISYNMSAVYSSTLG